MYIFLAENPFPTVRNQQPPVFRELPIGISHISYLISYISNLRTRSQVQNILYLVSCILYLIHVEFL